MQELVSVIIPTYNRGYCIAESVKSVLAQSYSELEVIVVDDGSADNTEQVIAEIKDERVKYGYFAENMGSSAARNKGVQLAKGKYIAFQDSDDIWDEKKLEKQMRCMRGEVGAVFCDYDYKEYGVIHTLFQGEDVKNCFEDDPLSILAKRNVVGTPTLLVKKQIFERLGGFREDLRSFEDWEFAVRLVQKAQVTCLNECLVHVTRHYDGVNDSSAFGESQMEALSLIYRQTRDYAWKDAEIWESNLYMLDVMHEYFNTEQQKWACRRFCESLNTDDKLFDKYFTYWRGKARETYRKRMVDALRIDSRQKVLCDELHERGYNSVAIYGIGIVGQALVDKMLSEEITIDYVIDRNPVEYAGVRAYTLRNIPHKVDVIIMTVYNYGKLVREVAEQTGMNVMPLTEIIP